MLTNAVRARNLTMGLYFSQFEWYDKGTGGKEGGRMKEEEDGIAGVGGVRKEKEGKPQYDARGASRRLVSVSLHVLVFV